MSTRRPRSRAVRPMPEGLESRRLLSSKTITGQDVDGDTWVLRLEGPGDFRVTKQTDSAGNAQSLTSASSIDSITVAGADPFTTRLVGQVKKGANGDGKVFFQSLSELGGKSEGVAATNGLLAIDAPDFWLGKTATTGTVEPSISIPDGIVTLRFGGADTTYTPPGGTPLNTNGTSDTFTVNLGLPRTQGTSIIINQSITSGQAGTSSTGSTGAATQDGVTFSVSGRINVFQANSIVGNTAFPTTGFRGGGGTIVASSADPTGTVTGQIGFVRVGGNATNFSAQTNDKIANTYIGGETNNVQILAPAGSRAVLFGKGMDNVTILTHYIDSLQANRGAVNSNVFIDRNVGRLTFGGDVIDTKVISGVEQNLLTVFTNQTAPTTNPVAQDGGALTNVLVAGNVKDSIFSASVEPDTNGTYGTPESLFLPHGHITAKVNGTIDNSTATPDSPTTAFYAKSVRLYRGPVIQPSVPELPFPNQGAPPTGDRVVKNLQPTENRRLNLFNRTTSTTKKTTSGSSGSSGTSSTTG